MITSKNTYYKERFKRFKPNQILNAEDLHFNNAELKKAASILRAINHPLRLKILQLLHSEQELSVTGIYNSLRTVQAAASLQLSILRAANLVVTRQQGQQVIYSVNYSTVEKLNKTIKDHLHG